jgi:anaerobic magnesium-protoporphyrin IX monomethyl ester cyclase
MPLTKLGGNMKVFLGNAPWYPLKNEFGSPATKADIRHWGVRAGSRWPHYEVYDKKLGRSLYIPFPHFLAIAATLLLNEGFEVSLVDGVAEGFTREQFLDRAKCFQPDVTFLEVSTPSILYDLDIARDIKEICPSTKIALGGLHPPMFKPEFLTEYPFIDYTLVGEYEVTLREMVLNMTLGKPLAFCKGLTYRGGEKNVFTGYRPLLLNLDDLPRPAYQFLPMDNYYDNPWEMPLPEAQVWTSRGCPFSCIFCAWPSIMYNDGTPQSVNKVRYYSPKRVAEEVKYLVDNFSMQSFYFDDDTVNLSKKRMLELCDALTVQGLDKLPWGMMARADLIDEEMLEAFSKAGLVGIKYGIESGVQELVDRAEKRLDLKKAREAINLTRQYGIKMHLTFVLGLPGETKETMHKTIDFALDSDPYSVQFSICTPFPGTPSYEDYKASGNLVEDGWDSFNGTYRSVIRTEELTAEELEEGLKTAYARWHEHRNREMKEDDGEVESKGWFRRLLGKLGGN